MNKYFVMLLCVSSCAQASQDSYVMQLRKNLRRRYIEDVTKIGKKKIHSGSQKRIERLLKGARKAEEDLNEADEQGRTLAHDLALLAASGYSEFLGSIHTSFLRAGVDFSIRDGAEQTPCDLLDSCLQERCAKIDEAEFAPFGDPYDTDSSVGPRLGYETRQELTKFRLQAACSLFVNKCTAWQERQLSEEPPSEESFSSDSDEGFSS